MAEVRRVAPEDIVRSWEYESILTWFRETILPGSSIEGTWEKFKEELTELEGAMWGRWQAETFLGGGNAEEDGIIREARRAEAEEAADVFISFIAWAWANGINLGQAVARKHVKNINRQWGPPDERGVRRHV